jgi:3-carboxy-cis,cis-muconate cycloisomerase
VATTLNTTDRMQAVFSDAARVSRMLDFEAALARAEAKVGVIPKEAAPAIERQCGVADYDLAALAKAAQNAGNLAIPLVAALTKRVADNDASAKGYVHWGATSQDAIDTGLVLQLRDALDLIDADVTRLAGALVEQVGRHRHTILSGRTWLQQALPVTLGLKLAGTLDAVKRHRARLSDVRARAIVLQFGGAAGTLASLGNRGIAVQAALADELRLAVPDIPWHTQRDRVIDVATALGSLTATLGKLARDLSLLSQTEVGEAFEPAAPGRGGSSTMPQKRNPVGCAIALAAATRVPGLVATMLAAGVQEHERGLGNWPAEWDALPAIAEATAAALASMADVVTGLTVDTERMRANLDISKGQIMAEAVQMALAPTIGRDVAHKLVAEASRKAGAEGRHLRDVLAAEPRVQSVLDASALAKLFDPSSYLGATDAFIDRVLASR